MVQNFPSPKPVAETFRANPSGRGIPYTPGGVGGGIFPPPNSPGQSQPMVGGTSEEKPADQVDTPSLLYDDLMPEWAVINAINSGTLGIRAKGTDYLPKEVKEKDAAYQRRLCRSYLSNWYQRLRDVAIAQVMRRPIQFNGLSLITQSHLDNIDLQGSDINTFSHNLLTDYVDGGCVGILIEYPKAPPNLNLAQERALNLRPYWLPIMATDIIGWRYRMTNGYRQLSQLRVKSSIAKPVGQFGEIMSLQVKVYELTDIGCQWQLYEEVENEWTIVETGNFSLPYIPLVVLGELGAHPIMLEIACANVKHYQLQNDLDHALHIAANPKLFLFGYTPDETEVSGGVDEALIFDNTSGRAEWISAPTTSFEPLANRIAALEQEMSVLALSSMLGQKNVAESGLSKQMDRVQSDSLLATLAQKLQDALDNCLAIHSDYLKEPAGTCQVNRDFSISRLSAEEVKTYLEMQQMGQLDLETLLEILVQGEWMPEEIDVSEIIERLKQPGVEEDLAAKTGGRSAPFIATTT